MDEEPKRGTIIIFAGNRIYLYVSSYISLWI